MKFPSKTEDKYWWVAFWTAFVPLCVSTLFILGGIFSYAPLVKPPGATWPIPFSSSICILLSSSSLLLLLYRFRYLPNLLGLLIFFISGWKILEFFSDKDLGRDRFFELFTPPSLYTVNHMTELSSLLFILIGFILIFWMENKGNIYTLARIFLSQLVFVMGILGFLSNFLPIETNFIWGGQEPIHLYSAICLLFIGASFVSVSFYISIIESTVIEKKLPFIVFVVSTCFTILLCLGIVKSRNDALNSFVRFSWDRMSEDLTSDFEERLASLKRMGKRIEITKTPPSSSWEIDVKGFIKEYPVFHQLLWLDKKLIVRNGIPKDTAKLGQSFFMSPSNLDQLEKVIAAQKKSFTLLVSSEDRSYRIQIFVPVRWDEAFQGMLVAEINANEYFKTSSLRILQNTFVEIVTYKGEVIFETESMDHNLKKLSHWHHQGDISFDKLVFSLQLYTEPKFFSGPLGVGLVIITFLGGLTISLALGGLVALWDLSKQQLSSLEKLHKLHEEAQSNLMTSLESGGIGTWIWDIPNDILVLDKQAQKLFGYEPGTFSHSFNELLERITQRDRLLFESSIKGLMSDPRGNVVKFEARIIWENNELHFISGKGRLFFNEEGEPLKVFGSIWDVTAIKLAHQRLEISQGVTRILSSALTVKEAATKILANLNKMIESEAIAIWQWDKNQIIYKCTDIVYASQVQTPNFKEMNEHLIGKDLTIVNHVAGVYRPITIGDPSEYVATYNPDPNSPDRIQGILAFPIFEGTVLTGVVELFKRAPYTVKFDEALENVLSTLGVIIGEFIQKLEGRRVREQLASIVTHSTDALFLLDNEGHIVTWNDGGKQIFGYTAAEIMGKNIENFIPKDQKAAYAILLETVLKGQIVQHVQMQGIRKNGELVWVQGSGAPIRDEEGIITHISVVLEDITKERAENIDIRKKEEKLHSILDTTEEWIWEKDTSHIFTYCSPGVTKILGYEIDEILYKDMFLFIYDDEREKLEEEYKNCLERKVGWRKRQLRWRHKDGSERWLEGNAEPHFDDNNKLIGFYGSERDITETLYAERVKNEFISLISHELRTPLTSIHGALGLLINKEKVSDEAKVLLELAMRNSNRLIQLINDLLDIQRFQLKKISFPIHPIPLDKALEEGVASAKLIAADNRREIILKVPLPHVIVNADHERLLQVMGNLLSNAIKFSPKDSQIIVSYEINGDRIRVSVTDHGKGIPKEFQPLVFQRFARAEMGDARVVPGTGLGLSIAKSIIENCGGIIGFTTEENVGTTFFFELPIVGYENADKK